MAFILVAGGSGTGKSTICSELRQLGFEAHDSDTEGNSVWVNRQTGQSVFPSSFEELTPDFFGTHRYRLVKSRLEELAELSKTEPVFFCGIVTTRDEPLELFDGIVYLTIDESTVCERLHARTNNPFGKSDYDLQLIHRWRKIADEEFQRLDAHMIDARQPLDRVVSNVIAYAESVRVQE